MKRLNELAGGVDDNQKRLGLLVTNIGEAGKNVVSGYEFDCMLGRLGGLWQACLYAAPFFGIVLGAVLVYAACVVYSALPLYDALGTFIACVGVYTGIKLAFIPFYAYRYIVDKRLSGKYVDRGGILVKL